MAVLGYGWQESPGTRTTSSCTQLPAGTAVVPVPHHTEPCCTYFDCRHTALGTWRHLRVNQQPLHVDGQGARFFSARDASHSAKPLRPSPPTSLTPLHRGLSTQARFAAARESCCPPRLPPLHWYPESVLHVEAWAGVAPAAITWAQSEAPRKGQNQRQVMVCSSWKCGLSASLALALHGS